MAESVHISTKRRDFFHDHGFVVIPSFVGEDLLQSMRKESKILLEILSGQNRIKEEENDTKWNEDIQKKTLESCGCVIEPLSLCFPHQNMAEIIRNYENPIEQFVKVRNSICNANEKDSVSSFICSEAIRSTIASLFAPTESVSVQLINEQYIIKPPHSSLSSFQYHKDCEYLETREREEHGLYISCWIAMDDMKEENGALYLIPFSKDFKEKAESSTEHHKRMGGLYKEKRFYEENWEENLDEEIEIPLAVPAGSMILLSSHVLHRSGNNISDEWRRAYMPQYLILLKEGEGKINRALLPPFPN